MAYEVYIVFSFITSITCTCTEEDKNNKYQNCFYLLQCEKVEVVQGLVYSICLIFTPMILWNATK